MKKIFNKGAELGMVEQVLTWSTKENYNNNYTLKKTNVSQSISTH